jgi:hypothetical protein
MADPREQILGRVEIILDGIVGIKKAGRNLFNLDSASDLPSAIVFDGDEEVQDRGAGRARPGAPHIVVMTPAIVLAIAGPPETIGASCRALLGKIIKAILQDGTLAGYTVDGEMGYEGCNVTILTDGSYYIAQTDAVFSFAYRLRAADL